MEGKIDVMSAFPEIDAQLANGTAPDFATADTPTALRESVDLVERAKRAAISTVMKGAMKFMATMREEQEFLEYAANQLITIYAMDSAVARALDAVKEGGVDARAHELLAQIAVLRLLPETRAAMEGALTMTFEGDERREEIAKVHRFLGDPEADVVPLQRELAGIVSARGGYPLK
ncbi:MAG TPA: hypothetical protein VGS80_19875 [Ktedonobacterales bacterium]|nr:hypothetical protein [Ktedonobacterales bacterium]